MKSLDEIKREKEQRQLGASAHETTRLNSLQAGGSAEDSGQDRNLFGKIPIDYRHLESDFCQKKTRFVNLAFIKYSCLEHTWSISTIARFGKFERIHSLKPFSFPINIQ